MEWSYVEDEIIGSATYTKGNSTYTVSIGTSLKRHTVKAEYSVSTKTGYKGDVSTTWGLESNPKGRGDNNFSHQNNLEPAFKEQTLNNTTWETALGPTLAVLGGLGTIISFGAVGPFVVAGFLGASGASHVLRAT